jgi:hypothetical protein
MSNRDPATNRNLVEALLDRERTVGTRRRKKKGKILQAATVCGFTIFGTSGMGVMLTVCPWYTLKKLFIIQLPYMKRGILLAIR